VTAGPSTSWDGRTTARRSTAPRPAGSGRWTSPTAWPGSGASSPWRRTLRNKRALPGPATDGCSPNPRVPSREPGRPQGAGVRVHLQQIAAMVAPCPVDVALPPPMK
jgi:hypothetical protein